MKFYRNFRLGMFNVIFLISLTAWSQENIDFVSWNQSPDLETISKSGTVVKFVQVTDQIYRSGRLVQDDIQTLKNKYGILTVINLENSEPHVKQERQTVLDLKMKFFSFSMSAFLPPNDKKVDQILENLKKVTNFPILIHCKHGEDRTGLIIGLYRVKVQGWAPKDAYNEMLQNGFHPQLYLLDRYFRDKTNYREHL